jgi:hypothetical protein
MNENKENTPWTDPVFGYYAEAVTPPPRLALAGVRWEPESVRSTRKMLQAVAHRMGAEYLPETHSARRRILSTAAVAAAELGGLKIVFVGSKCWEGDAAGEYTEAVLVCLYSDWPDELARPGLTLPSVPIGARLVHSIVASPDLLGDCLRVVRAVEDLGELATKDSQFPAAA